MKIVLIKLIAVFMLFAPVPHIYSGTAKAQKAPPGKGAQRYACPMHPEVVSTHSGKCPKCGMKLRVVKNEAAAAPATSVAASEAIGGATNPTSSSESLRIPDVHVYDQNGKRLNFYTDLVKGKTVAINFIFTTCTASCPSLTATFRRVQQELGGRLGRDLYLISVSVDPVTDVPERLHDYAVKFQAGPGWTFVTGEKAEINLLLRALGTAVADKNDHTPMILVGNDATAFWTRAYGLSSPITLVKVITDAANHK